MSFVFVCIYLSLLRYPALAGGAVPIYNIPELGSNVLTLGKLTFTNIMMGRITKWSNPQIIADNSKSPVVQNILSNLGDTPILVTVRTDSSGTSEIVTTALASFDPLRSRNANWDYSFANIATISSGTNNRGEEKPLWCGKLTDEIQTLKITNCDATLPLASRRVDITVYHGKYSYSFF